jgi:F-type H+-transporting ATPase subunit c
LEEIMNYLGLLALATGLGLPIAVIGASLGQGKAAAAALEGIARQPEAAGKLQTAMIIALALIESLVIYALLMFFILSGKLPTLTAEQAVQTSAPAASAPAAP